MIVTELFAKLGIEMDAGTVQGVENLLGKLNLKLLGLGAAAAAIGGALVYAMKDTQSAALEASKAAQRTGLTADAWQELKAAANAAGVDAGQLEHSLVLLSKTAYGAAEGSEEMSKSLKDLGLSVKGSDGHLKNGDELLTELADKFANMPDGIRKVSLATKAFGRSGAELLPFLNKGSAGIAALREQARSLGVVIDGETIAASKEWARQTRELNEMLEGLKYKIGGALIRAFVRFKAAAGKVFAQLHESLARLLRLWKTFAIIGVAAAFAWTAANAGLAASFLTAGAAAVWAGLSALGAWLLAIAPVVLLTAIVAGLILAFEDFLTFLEGGDSLIGDLGPKWTTFLDRVLASKGDDPWWLAALKEAGRDLFDLQGTWERAVKWGMYWFDQLFTFIKSGWASVVEGFRGTLAAQFGLGASSPAVSAGSSTAATAPGAVLAPSFRANINVTAPAGLDAKEVASHTVEAFDQWWADKMSHGFSGVDQ